MSAAAVPPLPVHHVRRRALDIATLGTQPPDPERCRVRVAPPCAVKEGDDLRIVALNLLETGVNLTRLAAAVQHLPFQRFGRVSGVPREAVTFGYAPRSPLAQDYCTAARLRVTDPGAEAALCRAAQVVARFYRAYHPALYAWHYAWVRTNVLPMYRLPGSPFTSGVVNRSTLPFHHDGGNLPGGWSGMLVFRYNVSGGELVIPELDLAVALPDHSLLLFDGAALVHGVVPVTPTGADSFRRSVVYYSRRAMWECAPPDRELERIRRLGTERSRRSSP